MRRRRGRAPGVGAFDTAVRHLGDGARPSRARSTTDGVPRDLPRHAALFDGSEEGELDGLGVSRAGWGRLAAQRLPHIGWELVSGPSESHLDASNLTWGYYAHSFVCPQNGVHRVTSTSRIEGQPFPRRSATTTSSGSSSTPRRARPRGRDVDAFLDEVARDRGPRVDLRDGAACSWRWRLDDELIRLDDPVGVASWWRDLGSRACTSWTSTRRWDAAPTPRIAEAICHLAGVAVQVGGGVRD